MKKSTAVKRAEGRRNLAAILGITTQAISQWKGEHIPEARLKQLRKKRPAWFADGKHAGRATVERVAA